VSNHSKQTKNEKNVGLELERSLKLFFNKNRSKKSHILFLHLLSSSFTPDAQRTFVALQFAHSMTQNLVNLAKELGKYWKVFYDRYMFRDGRFNPSPSFPFLLNQGANYSPSIV